VYAANSVKGLWKVVASQYLRHNHAQSIHILSTGGISSAVLQAAGVIPFKVFWCQIPVGASSDECKIFVGVASNAKVAQLVPAGDAKEDVVWLDVPVDSSLKAHIHTETEAKVKAKVEKNPRLKAHDKRGLAMLR
jgi:hypothetical protein